jgi:predicted SAM-dependent methyltransferase
MVEKYFIKLENFITNRMTLLKKFISHLRSFGNDGTPIFPRVTQDGPRINFGSGNINLQGWINIDARNLPHVHIVETTFELNEFSENSISEIYLCHVLEHFSFSDVSVLLKMLSKKLKSGGIVRISVPSFDSIVKIYSKNSFNIKIVKNALMGGQDYDYNYHKSIFNKKYLTELLLDSGYDRVEEWETLEDFGVDLGDWSNKSYLTDVGLVPISLNLKARKKNSEARGN